MKRRPKNCTKPIFVSSRSKTGTSHVVLQRPGPSMVLFVGSERRRGKQVENKERHFEEVAKGKYARTCACLRMKTTHLKRFMLRSI